MTHSIILLVLAVGSQSYASAPLESSATIKSLQGKKYWIQPNSFGVAINRPLKPGETMRGENCTLSAIGSQSRKLDNATGTEYDFAYHGVPVQSRDAVILWTGTFRNSWSNPHVLLIRCNTPRNFSLTIGEIEKDLSRAIHFYKP